MMTAPPALDKPLRFSGAFDTLLVRDLVALQQAARNGPLHLLLWSDAVVQAVTGQPPRFPAAERRYLLEAIRWVDSVTLTDAPDSAPPLPGLAAPAPDALPDPTAEARPTGRPGVLVTGCYDWLHSGHVRFFEEVASYGELTVVVGNDANVRGLKGPGHPLFPEQERRFRVGAIRHVHRALIASGMGWLDAEAEIRQVRPAIYAVNEDGDKPEKRRYCDTQGIRYLVLKRLPRPGLPPRHSTGLRGF
jgi:cytidyltransferase-like protein